MSKSNFTLWSPHREENSVRAFKALLGLRPDELWTWHDQAQSASLWVVDGSRSTLPELTAALHQQKAKGPVHAALLAPDWSAVKDPIWTFFKTPLQVSHIYRWVDSSLPLLPRASAGATSMLGQRLRLKRWPNMSRYASSASVADSMELTVACAKMLKDWANYDEVLGMVRNATALELLLSDALQDGILELSPASVAPSPTRVGHAPLVSPDDPGTWSLVKRLIQKFK